MKLKVLVVDDSQTIRKIVRTNLERIGINNILEVSDGESALRTLSANPDINLMFIDYNMPVMNGLAAVKKIRENKAYDQLKIIVISSAFDPSLMGNFEKLNVAGFIAKPFDLQKFNSTVAPILESPVEAVGAGVQKGVPKEDVIRLFSTEKPDINMNGKFVEFDFKNEKIKLEVDVISRYGSVYVELGD
jgi:two-component system chemotaxis response regulator CheY